MAEGETHFRVAVAEDQNEDVVAPRLGRAVRFALFDVTEEAVRGPFYRVRHDSPGACCEGHGELVALLHDCKAVIAGSAGPRMAQRLLLSGIEVVETTGNSPAGRLAARHLPRILERLV